VAIREFELILPALEVLAAGEFVHQGASVRDLIPHLRAALRPEGRDTEPMAKRGDDYFSQKVRNLMCHRTLEKQGLATFVEGEPLGRLRITDKGRTLLRLAQASARPDGQLALPLHP
jgi:hypothetical protein